MLPNPNFVLALEKNTYYLIPLLSSLMGVTSHPDVPIFPCSLSLFCLECAIPHPHPQLICVPTLRGAEPPRRMLLSQVRNITLRISFKVCVVFS